MKLFMRPTAVALLLLICFTGTIVAQQKRQTPARPQPRVAPTPPPTFDTVIPADTYNIYAEVRNVGHVIKSSAATELLDPVLKLAAPPKEFNTFVNWLNANADELMTSRLLVATWASGKDVPEAIIAIEFASPEEAAKFAKPLNEFLPTILPPTDNFTGPGQRVHQTAPATPPGPPKPSYYLQQTGSLILLTPKPLNLKKFRPAGSKPMSEDINLRAARNRFNSEAVFVFIDMKTIEREEEERRKKYETARQEMEEQQKAKAADPETKIEEATEEEIAAEIEAQNMANAQEATRQGDTLVIGEAKQTRDPVSEVIDIFGSAVFGNSSESNWPEAIAFGLSIENETFDIRALLLNQPGEKSDTVPFMPLLIPGQALVPESPNVLPADSELLVTMSLDLPQIYTLLSKPPPNPTYYTSRGNVKTVHNVVRESPFAALEKRLQLSIKDDVLPLFGQEVAVHMSVGGIDLFGMPKTPSDRPPESQSPTTNSPILLLSVKDREGVRALMPKIIEAMGLKGASALAQTERREDTEIVSYAGMFAYAFVGNFLVLSSDVATTRHVVDCYLKHETLGGDTHFKYSTRWQPRPAYGMIYVSPVLTKSFRLWSEQRSTRISDQTRAILARLTADAQPITYSLSNEGLGPLHEVRLPRNLVLMAVAGISGETNPPPELVNERRVAGAMHQVAYAQQRYKEEKGNGSYGTLEQLIAEEMVSKDTLEIPGYRLDMTVTGDKFEITAVPVEYGKSGTLSYFIDQTFVLRGGDRNGSSASSSDPAISN